jgi:2',3'-cyclic-nucleotide 2'-phosphodiesterase (5'-nucleotidase family)
MMNRLLPFLVCTLLFATPAVSETAKPELHLDLNALQPAAGACRVTFLATNDLGAALDKATFELAIFGKDGAIVRLVALDFKGMTAGKTKVVQFDLKDIDCKAVSRVLINDVTACSGAGIEATACLAGLRATTGTGILFDT